MEQRWRSLAVAVGKHWKVVAAVVAVISAALVALGATRLEFATGQDSYLNPDSQIAIDNVAFQDEFGGETVILLFTASDDGTDVSDLFAGANLAELRRLNAALAEVGDVRSVVTPLTSLVFSDALVAGAGQTALLSAPSRDDAGADARTADISLSLARLGDIPNDRRGLDASAGGAEPDPAWIDLLIFGNDGFSVVDGAAVPPADADRAIRRSLAGTFPDQATAVGGVVLGGNLDLDRQSAATQRVLDVLRTATFEGFDLTVTGSPVYLKEINDYLKGGMLTLGVTALVAMAVVLVVMFKVRWRLLPLLAVIVGILWTFSFLGLIGISLSLVTISGLPILIGVGIDFAIQIHNRVEEEVTLDREEHPIAETLANLVPPLIAAALAGVCAFVALRISKVPMIRDFGVLLAVGIVVLAAVGVIVPASALGIREWRSRTTDRGESLVERVVVKLGSLPVSWGLALVAVSVVVFVGGIVAETRTRIESDPIRWIDQNSEVVRDVDRLVDETGFATTLGVIVRANNVFDPAVVELIHEFTIAAEERPEVITSSSLVNTMAKILVVDGASVIAPTSADIVGAAEAMPPDIARALINADGTAAQVNLRLAAGSLEDRAVLVADLAADLDRRIAELDLPADSILLASSSDTRPPVSATPAGLATVGIGLLENLSANRAALTYLALTLAGLFVLLRFRSLSRALLALVPVFLGVGASSLIVGLLGIQLSPLTTVSGPLIIASCTEFSVLIMGRYLEERQRGLTIDDANRTAASRTGRAFFVSAATTIAGFATLIISPLPLLRDFGLIVTLNVAIALAAALVVMPPMLSWVDSKGWLGVDEQVDPTRSVRLASPIPGEQTMLFGVGTVAMAVGAGVVYGAADTSRGSATTVEYAAVALPTTTTTTTLPPPTTVPTTVEGQAPDGPKVDPGGFPDTPPEGAIAAVLFQRLQEQGVAGNVAHCAIVTAYAVADETTLIGLGIADGNPDALAIVVQGGLDCGIPQDVIDAAIAAQFGG
jgi:hydrophobe/amphiphile efflux-3 (HAE3) family protein